jgi:hypothetical protein
MTHIEILLEVLIKESISGYALEVVKNFTIAKRTGIEILKRIIEIFSMTLSQIALIPFICDWSKYDINRSWAEYKKSLHENNFSKVHPSLTSTAIARAKYGFETFESGMRLLDYLGISLGEGHEHSWEEFVKYVEKFLGDKYRREFERSVL